VGFEANLPGPGKRPLSSMSPTIVLKDGKPVLVTGSPGGSRIISAVTQVIVNAIDYKMDIAAAVAAPRMHHQWLPEDVRFERGFPEDVLAELKAKGHKVIDQLGQTSANSIGVTPHGLLGAPDPRTRGAWAEGQRCGGEERRGAGDRGARRRRRNADGTSRQTSARPASGDLMLHIRRLCETASST